MNLPEEIRRAWADRCGLSWDESDDRVREPEKYGWPKDFELFYAGWKSAYVTAQERVPDAPALPWTGDVQGRRPASCASSALSETGGTMDQKTLDQAWDRLSREQTALAEPCQRLGCRFDVAQALLNRAKERGELSDAERSSAVSAGECKTPRTDAAEERVLMRTMTPQYGDLLEHARQLERELAQKTRDHLDALNQRNDEARLRQAAERSSVLSSEGVAIVTVREDVVRFLLGEGPLDGKWYGDRDPGQPAYWWRNPLRLSMHPYADSATAAPAPKKNPSHGTRGGPEGEGP
jgi:hypothetical protein